MENIPAFSQVGNTLTVTFPRSEQLTPSPRSVSASTGFNLSEFSLAPLDLRTQHLAHDKRIFEWTYNRDDTNHTCFFEVQYGEPAPNAYTEDALLVLAHLMYQSDTPLTTRASIYEILKLQGQRHKPNKTQIDQVVRHLDALCAMQIHTNFVYDREDREWRSVKTGVLSGYSYKDERGKVRRCRAFVRHGAKTEAVEIFRKQRVFELKEISFAPLFIKYFLRDTIPIDLGVYFTLQRPTPKRIYRYGNKYVQTVGHHAMDLRLFCLSRIGMSPCYVMERHPSYLAARIRKHANRVTETGHLTVGIERSGTPSGYKITFDKASAQIPLFAGLTSFTELEKEAFRALRKGGVWDTVARGLVVTKRNALGKEGARYITFAVRQFLKYFVKAGKLRVPPEKQGGVLARAIKSDWYYPPFYEQQATEERRLWREEDLRYPAEPAPAPTSRRELTVGHITPRGDIPDSSSTLDRFPHDHPETYRQIVDAVTLQYDTPPPSLNLSDALLETMRQEAIRSYCLQCITEFNRGNHTFFPQNLLSDS